MKRLALILCLILLPVFAFGQDVVVAKKKGSAVTLGDKWNESFDSSSDCGDEHNVCENTWTAQLGDPSTLDPNSTGVTPPTDGGTNVCYCPSSATNYDFWLINNGGTDMPITYARFYFYPATDGMGMWGGTTIFAMRASSHVENVTINYMDDFDNGYNKLRTYVNVNGSTSSYYSGQMDVGSWYCIELRYDATNHVFAWKVDGVQVGTDVTLTDGHGAGTDDVMFGSWTPGSVGYLNYYIDRISVDNDGWIGQ